ncbi:hypothetical protein [Microbacterium sp. ACRRU]|uniref:hypothetical protein n=1 Tax=Microbacterium sp. ACRRU TaxID=2918204 RepID=UPI001EF7220B|nr:hypothetical protein [Microbacterium sp. ACRRU]
MARAEEIWRIPIVQCACPPGKPTGEQSVKYSSEAEIKKALDIESWRNLSKDKMIRFAAMMPDMDREVALKIVEQFPAFKDFAMETVGVMERAQESALQNNKESQAQVHQAFQEIREILKGELAQEDLPWEQRKQILELILETGNKEFAKDTENKDFLKQIMKGVGVVAVSALALGIVFVGGKIMMEQSGDALEA